MVVETQRPTQLVVYTTFIVSMLTPMLFSSPSSAPCQFSCPQQRGIFSSVTLWLFYLLKVSEDQGWVSLYHRSSWVGIN